MADATTSAKSQKRPSPAKNGYLVLYNAVSALAWSVVLGRTVALLYLRGPRFVWLGVGDWTRWTQTVAGMEVLHAIFCIVRAPIITTLMQVLSRFLLVWGIVHPFPWLARSPAYSTMLLAWSITEVVRYTYFAANLSGWQPKLLVWLRYNTFFVLYPMGILSECVLIWKAAEPAREFGEVVPWVNYVILAVYVPGSYILFTYMMKQRRKVMRSMKAEEMGESKNQ